MMTAYIPPALSICAIVAPMIVLYCASVRRRTCMVVALAYVLFYAFVIAALVAAVYIGPS